MQRSLSSFMPSYILANALYSIYYYWQIKVKSVTKGLQKRKYKNQVLETEIRQKGQCLHNIHYFAGSTAFYFPSRKRVVHLIFKTIKSIGSKDLIENVLRIIFFTKTSKDVLKTFTTREKGKG